MNWGNFITSYTGLIHFIASLFALVFGTLILVLTKGTKKHITYGRLYGLSMLVVLATAFMIYRLWGAWGVFHWVAVLSSVTLLAGFLPVLIKQPAHHYISLHYSFMYWSVMGVYGAFVSETLVRIPNMVMESGIPNTVFYSMTGIGTALVMGAGSYYFLKFKAKWDMQFGQKANVK